MKPVHVLKRVIVEGFGPEFAGRKLAGTVQTLGERMCVVYLDGSAYRRWCFRLSDGHELAYNGKKASGWRLE